MNYSLRPYQLNKVAEARAMMGSGKKSICLVSPTGSGKCLGQGTPVLMYDGQIKAVEDIVAGDRLMGPDSGPRNVLSVCSGSEMLYRVTPVKGDPYVVNASHILSLKRTHEPNVKKTGKRDRGGEIVNLSVTEYLGKSATFKHLHKGWRTGVDFKNQELFLIDPYFLGLWLGDGTQRTSAITTGDHEIIDWVIEYSKYLRIKYRIENNSENSVNIHITTGIRGANNGGNPIVNALDRYGLRQIKHVPHAYKTASRYDRLKLLAGFIDADGSLQAGGYDVVGINERLIDDIIFVARSLGFAAYKSPCKKTCGNNGKTGNYFRCNINGNTDEIPCLIERKKAAPRRQKKSVLVTGITVEPIGVGRYYGFEIDGDRLFMLGDFTVTHNTVIAAHIILSALSKGRRVLFLAHRRELINQCADKLRALGILDYNVILPRHPQANNQTSQMHIASIQTLIRRELPPADLIIIDECLTGDSLISTPIGNVPIKDIVAGSSVMTYNNGVVTEANVTAAWSSGEKEIIKIITQSGVEIKCTKNHLIYTESGWIPASEITASSKVLLLAPVDAERLCTKINGGDSKFSLMDIKSKKGLWRNGIKNIKRSWLLSRYAYAVVEKKQDSVTGLLWKNSLNHKALGAFISACTGMIKDPHSGKWKLPIVSVKPYLEPCLGIPASCIQTTGALTQDCNSTTANLKRRGLNIKKIILSGLEDIYQGRLMGVTENSLFLIHLNVYRVWLMFMTSALKTEKKPLAVNGLIRLAKSGWRGGSAMTAQAAGAASICIPKDTPWQRMKSFANGLETDMARQVSKQEREDITGSICLQTLNEKSCQSSINISQSSCNTSWQEVAYVQRLPKKEVVYDITVAGTHCFFANGILVHNCHHAAARQYQSLLTNYPNSYVLGLTATPERLDGKGLDDIFQDLLEVATVPQLIEQGFLVKPTCLSPSIEMAEKIKESLSGLKIRGGDYDEGELGDAMDNKVLIGDIIEHWKEWAFGQKTIVFAASILHSQHIVEQFTNAGIAAAHIDGKMGTKERERILSAWRTPELDVVSNCQILCLDEKTEILTDSGWYGIDDINAQSRVANWDNGSIFFEEPLDIFKRDRGVDERMFSIHHHSARVTEGHNILAASGRKQDVWKKRPVESLAGKSYAMPVSGLAPPKPIDLPEQSFPKSNRGRLVAALSYHLRKTHGMPSVEARNEAINRVDTRHSMRYTPVDKLTEEQCRLIGLFHADGTKTPLHKGGVEFRFSTSKHQPFIVEAFNRVFDGVDFHRIGREKQSTIDWSFSRGTGGGSQKRAGVFEIEIYLEKGNLDFLWGLNEHQFDAFIYGFWLGDGNHGNDGIYSPATKTICLFQANPVVLDIIQAVAVCRKYKSYLSYKSNGKKFRIGTLFLSKKSTHRIASRHSWVEESSYMPERVWCVKTSSGNIITRRNGSVTVMGNCEGFDYPELSCCIEARPTKSLALHLQMVGRIMRVANGKNGATILDHAGNILEHGVPHAERIWTLEGSAKKRKPEKPHACFMPGCGAMFVESDAGAILWIAEDQTGIIENYRFIARKFENMDAGSSETKLIVCPLCHHGSCKFCGEFVHDQGHTGDLVCENCQGVYVRSKPVQEGKAGRELPECADGTLELVDEVGEANDKIVVKNEYHRLLNVAGKKGFNRGWVWHRLTEKFSEDQLRCLPRHPRGWWKQPASEK